jgi:hypothetical protein
MQQAAVRVIYLCNFDFYLNFNRFIINYNDISDTQLLIVPVNHPAGTISSCSAPGYLHAPSIG